MITMTQKLPLRKNYFVAKWPGRCHNCAQVIEEGEQAFYAGGRDNTYGVVCCGDIPVEELIKLVLTSTYEDEEEDYTDHKRTEPIDKVMPRGRAARDICMTCFQIPASNGDCGCDY